MTEAKAVTEAEGVKETNKNKDLPDIAIYRARDGRAYNEVSNMYPEPISPTAAEGWAKLSGAGYNEGNEVKLLFSAPGFSLTYAWFKSGTPLPRHSHNADCLYYIIAGSLTIGTEELGAGDGFFVGSDVPYAYVPGEEGIEILEFRSSDSFSIKFLADNPAFWNRAVEEVNSRRGAWASESRPTSTIR